MTTDDEFPFVKPEGSDAEMFIQWKGTDLCMDFWCPCGAEMHFDGDFAYYVGCPACRTIYRMGMQVIVRKVEATEPGDNVKWMELDDPDEPEPRPNALGRPEIGPAIISRRRPSA